MERVTQEELDDILVKETGISIKELKDRSREIELGEPWDSEIILDHEDSSVTNEIPLSSSDGMDSITVTLDESIEEQNSREFQKWLEQQA